MATLKDVAAASGLGLGTVSRALSGHANVHPATRRRVEEVARQLGYQPNVLARSLRRNSSKVIGLVIPDLENSFYTSGAAQIQEILAEEGYQLIVGCSSNDPGTDAALLLSLVERRVDGIAHVPCTPGGADQIRATNPKLPIVEYARRSSTEGVDSIVGDEVLGSQLLVQQLVDAGHSRIGMIAGPASQSTTTARVMGFLNGVRLAGLDSAECPVIHGSYDPAWGEEGARRLLREHPRTTAIFASSSTIVLGAYRVLASLGIRIPQDVSVVGFLNPPWFDVLAPPVTTYELPLKDMGSMVADLLLKRIRSIEADDPLPEPRTVRLEGKLIPRASVARPRETALAAEL